MNAFLIRLLLISLVLSVFCGLVSAHLKGMTLVGGTGDVRGPEESDQEIANQMRAAAEAMAGRSFPKFEVTAVRTQLVAGTNYFMKVDVGDGNFIHLRIYQTLPHAGSTLELSNMQDKKQVGDELEYF